MFEKEAEERARKLEEKQTLGVYDNNEDLARDEGFNNGEVCGYENGFQEGATFGYNKAKEEAVMKLKGVTMFEKEAEEWIKNNFHSTEEDYIKAFEDGAEFGYNKAKEEAKDIINELLMNGYCKSTRDKAFNFLYPDKKE